MGGYPPGTSRRDLERAGIITHPVNCPECDSTINKGEDHKEWCRCEMSIEEMQEYWAERDLGADKADYKEL